MHFVDQFAKSAKDYIATTAAKPVYPTDEALHNPGTFDTALQQEPLYATEVLALLDAIGSPATVKTTGGRYYGFVNGGSLPAAMAAIQNFFKPYDDICKARQGWRSSSFLLFICIIPTPKTKNKTAV